ncbi:MAG: response regulator transcription factor [Verrucomicrobiae bacterium]|nr:response regulator transcription factor [Verrucomicrobiae bacterium]MCP5523919.1 response regulator transcription factor [Verrucomicrobiales bacterium]
MNQPARILIVDDHPIFREGVKQVLAAAMGVTVVGEARDGPEALSLVESLIPDVVLLDLSMPGPHGLDLIEPLRGGGRRGHVVVLTMHREDQAVCAALDRGAEGYVLKESAAETLVQAIQTVLRGEVYVTPVLAGALVRRSNRSRRLHQEQPGLDQLTPTERRVLKLVAASHTSREIAARLFVSPRTVETHRAHICEKLGLHGNHALLQFAIEHRAEL